MGHKQWELKHSLGEREHSLLMVHKKREHEHILPMVHRHRGHEHN